MQQSTGRRPLEPAVYGLALIVVGVAALAIREYDVNFLPHLGTWGWPLFVILPGLVLIGASLRRPRPSGAVLAVPGAVVTTVGCLLLYQSMSGHWESWAYAWALLPGSAGAALLAYGLYAGDRDMWTAGAWLAGIALILFVAGAWFFEGLFSGDNRFVEAGDWWPVAVIALGSGLSLWAFLRRSRPPGPTPGQPSGG